ncbi:MAG: glycosyltransferase [Candidatus Neomarinimicrobiota bacterium]|nr:MAG: glycosyltransferase [Candidatus Neomarinimicrobiota bacterium]
MSTLLLAGCGLYVVFVLALLRGLNRLGSPPAPPDTLPPVSVVIAARNEQAHLPALLEALDRQNYSGGEWECIVVDDRSTDGTGDLLDTWCESHPRFRALRISQPAPNMTPKKWALTQGIEAAGGDIILATDADCVPPPGWIHSMVSRLLAGDPPPGIVVGFSRMSDQHPSLLTAYQRVDFLAVMSANAGAIGQGWGWSGSGQNLAYRKQTFEEIGGFEPVADRISGDDVYLVQSIAPRAPVAFNADPRSFMTTQPVTRWKTFLHQHIRWSSNSKHLIATDRRFLLFLVAAFLTNLSLLIGWIWWDPGTWLLVALVKFLLEMSVLFQGAQRFQTPVVPAVCVLWFLLQPLYIPITGIGGLIGRYRWK